MNEFELNITKMGREIQNARYRADLSQEELARRAGTTKTTISDIENGTKRNGGGIALIAKIAYELGLSLDSICEISAKPAKDAEQDEKDAEQDNKDKVLEAIKVLIDPQKDISFRITFSNLYKACLNIFIDDTGLAYFAQEYAKALEMIEVNKDTEYYDTIKNAVLKAFESRFSGMKKGPNGYYLEGKYFEAVGEIGDTAGISLNEDAKPNPPDMTYLNERQ